MHTTCDNEKLLQYYVCEVWCVSCWCDEAHVEIILKNANDDDAADFR